MCASGASPWAVDADLFLNGQVGVEQALDLLPAAGFFHAGSGGLTDLFDRVGSPSDRFDDGALVDSLVLTDECSLRGFFPIQGDPSFTGQD